jgi:hypothetical protein
MSSDHSDPPILAERRKSGGTTPQVGGVRRLDTDQVDTARHSGFRFSRLIL